MNPFPIRNQYGAANQVAAFKNKPMPAPPKPPPPGIPSPARTPVGMNSFFGGVMKGLKSQTAPAPGQQFTPPNPTRVGGNVAGVSGPFQPGSQQSVPKPGSPAPQQNPWGLNPGQIQAMQHMGVVLPAYSTGGQVQYGKPIPPGSGGRTNYPAQLYRTDQRFQGTTVSSFDNTPAQDRRQQSQQSSGFVTPAEVGQILATRPGVFTTPDEVQNQIQTLNRAIEQIPQMAPESLHAMLASLPPDLQNQIRTESEKLWKTRQDVFGEISDLQSKLNDPQFVQRLRITDPNRLVMLQGRLNALMRQVPQLRKINDPLEALRSAAQSVLQDSIGQRQAWLPAAPPQRSTRNFASPYT